MGKNSARGDKKEERSTQLEFLEQVFHIVMMLLVRKY